MSAHVVLEMRTSRSAEHAPDAAVQLFASLPDLMTKFRIPGLSLTEHLSFEFLVENQTIYCLCHTPARLAEYVASLVQASYPEVLISLLPADPVDVILTQAKDQKGIDVSWLELKHAQFLPLKTFIDFKNADPLATVLSTLSKTQPGDKILVQFVVAPDNENWKNSARGQITGEKPHPQKNLIESKLKSRSHKVAIRLVTISPTKERAQLVANTISSAYQAISQSEGNQLKIKRPLVGKARLMENIRRRSFGMQGNFHLSIEELATLFHLPSKKLAHVNNIAWGKQLLGEAPENLPVITKDMPAEQKKEINAFGRTDFKNVPSVYGLKRNDRRKHMYVIGKTGTGKSTLLANMAINDLKNDEGLCVIDPHGDLVETLLDYIPSHRINDVVYFDPSDTEKNVQINLFEGKNIVHRELIASGIVSIFYKLYGYTWGPRLEHILRNALLTLLTAEHSRMSDIVDLLTNKGFRDGLVDELEDPILKNFWVNEFNKMQDRQRSEAIAPILNKVGQFVSSPLVRNVVNAHQSSFSIEEIMDEGKILLVNLSQGRLGEDNATLLGAMLITKIQLAAMARVHMAEEKRRDFYLYVDEFQNFATTSFIKILSEARKYRLNLILANQYIAQIPEEVQKAIFGNCGSVVNFIMGSDDAKVFASEYGKQYTEEDLVSLGRYQIINKISIDNITSKPFPAGTLSLASSRNNNKNKVIKVSRERYAKAKLDEKVTSRRVEREQRKEQGLPPLNEEGEGGDDQQPRRSSGYQGNRPQGGGYRSTDRGQSNYQNYGERNHRDNRGDRPRDDRPRDDRPRYDKPYADRPRDGRPRDDRPRNDQPRIEQPRDVQQVVAKPIIKPKPVEPKKPMAIDPLVRKPGHLPPLPPRPNPMAATQNSKPLEPKEIKPISTNPDLLKVERSYDNLSD